MTGDLRARRKFQNPPINELVIALYHLPLSELRTQHIGVYWDQIKDKYPICEQQHPFITETDASVLQPVAGEVFPLPRFWFRSNAHSFLIQVQRNAFMLNWRRPSQSPEYPHYEAVQEEFWNQIGIYKEFIQKSVEAKLDVVNRCELTYINLIARNSFFSSNAEIDKVLPSLEGFCNFANDARQLAGLSATAVYRLNANLLIELTAKLGRRKDEPKEEITILEIKAHGTPLRLSLEAAHDWYETAHEAIYETFITYTNKRVQEEVWKLL